MHASAWNTQQITFGGVTLYRQVNIYSDSLLQSCDFQGRHVYLRDLDAGCMPKKPDEAFQSPETQQALEYLKTINPESLSGHESLKESHSQGPAEWSSYAGAKKRPKL